MLSKELELFKKSRYSKPHYSRPRYSRSSCIWLFLLKLVENRMRICTGLDYETEDHLQLKEIMLSANKNVRSSTIEKEYFIFQQNYS